MKKRKHKAEGGGLLPYDLASLAARSHPYLSLLKGQAEGAWGAMGETGRSGTEGMMSALENEYKPEGAAAVNDAGEWLDASGQVLPRQRRPNILPVTRKPSEPDPMTGMPVRGELEPAMPAMADVWNTLGNPFKAGAGVALGSGLTNPFKATAEPFYSALQQAVDNAKIGKGSPEQWLGTLKPYNNEERMKKAAGGGISGVRESAKQLSRAGLINSSTAGRADRVNSAVKPGSYVFPADVVSALGQGNTLSGAKVLNKLMTSAPFGAAAGKAPRGGSTRGMTSRRMGRFADGGNIPDVDIAVSGGEFIATPEQVAALGDGDIDYGHEILDAFVKEARRNHISHLENLPPPRKD